MPIHKPISWNDISGFERVLNLRGIGRQIT